MEKTYTKAEFERYFDDPAIKDFFKHIDRKTTSIDFFAYFGISKDLIKAENKHNYSIPYRVAPLLAGMIKAFQHVYGSDRRGRQRGERVPIDYKAYHDYLDIMQREIEKLEPYQQALIKNYHSFDNAKIIDRVIPLLIERISMLLILLFEQGGNRTSDNFFTIIRFLDSAIEGLARQHVRENPENEKNQSSGGIYSFENAISDVFGILAGKTDFKPAPEQVASVELVEKIIDAIRSADDEKSTVCDSTQMPNNAYNAYNLTHQDKVKLHDRNIEFELQLADSMWSAKSFMGREFVLQLGNVSSEIRKVVEMSNCTGDYACLKEIGDNEELILSRIEKINPNDKTIYQAHRSMLWTFKTDALEGTPEYYQFIEEKIEEQEKQLIAEAERQDELHQDRYRVYLRDIYHREKGADRFELLENALSSVITQLLTQQSELTSTGVNKEYRNDN